MNEDEAGNYEKALQLYTYALEYFKTHLKYEKNERAKQAIKQKVGLCCIEHSDKTKEI